MDGSAIELTLDALGVCNFCKIAQWELALAEKESIHLGQKLEQIQRDGKRKKYDCLIGLSGGADSSTVLHHAVRLGLRPFCYSIDNGYNDPKSDENILRLVEQLKVPFYRYTIDLVQFHKLQGAFLKAGLINAEIPTDHILMTTSYEMADKYGIKWILSGGNVATESIMPASWSYPARDLRHVRDVYRKMTGKILSGLPVCGLLKWNWYHNVKRIKIFYLLDYLGYNRQESTNLLQQEYGWKDYHEKHCESLFTWWFQNYYLFEKFGIDKRKAHYSSLINSKQMTRQEAIRLLGERPIYPQLGLEKKVMHYQKHRHEDFKTDQWYNRISKVIRYVRGR